MTFKNHLQDLAILTLNLMATRETSSQGRNLYLTASKDLREQLEGKKKNRKDTYTSEAVKEALDARELLRVLKVTVDPDRAEELVGGADEEVRVRLEAKRDKKGTVADVTEFKVFFLSNARKKGGNQIVSISLLDSPRDPRRRPMGFHRI